MHGQHNQSSTSRRSMPWEVSVPSARACMQDASCEENAALIEAVNQTGRAFLSHTELGGVYTLRFAVSGAQTQVGCRVWRGRLHTSRGLKGAYTVLAKGGAVCHRS